MASVTLYVNVECECGESLRVLDLSRGDDILVMVKACECCIEAAKEEGYDEGYSRGYSAGVRES